MSKAYKIKSVEAIPVSYQEPTDHNRFRAVCLVKITGEDGQVGWGECCSYFPEATPRRGQNRRRAIRDCRRSERNAYGWHLARLARSQLVVWNWRWSCINRDLGDRYCALGPQGQDAWRQRARPLGRANA